jgi:uncharacterized protein YbbK (DUF523 family)
MPAEIQGGDGGDVLAGRSRVITQDGRDCTEEFLCGARETLKTVMASGVLAALFKARSPSCGNCGIYDGSFNGITRDGAGVAAAMLLAKGIPVFNEEQLESLEQFLSKTALI